LYVDDRKITLFVNKVLGFTILNYLRGMYCGILASLDGVFLILCLLICIWIHSTSHSFTSTCNYGWRQWCTCETLLV